MKNKSSSSSGMGVCGVLFLVFLVLKLVGVISWSWWWVTSPLWIGFCVSLLVIGGVLLYYKLKG